MILDLGTVGSLPGGAGSFLFFGNHPLRQLEEPEMGLWEDWCWGGGSKFPKKSREVWHLEMGFSVVEQGTLENPGKNWKQLH